MNTVTSEASDKSIINCFCEVAQSVIVIFCFFVGMINILHGLGLRFLALGHHTPFMVREHSSPVMRTTSCIFMWFLSHHFLSFAGHSTSAWLITTGMSARPSRQWGIVGMRSPWDSCPNQSALWRFVSPGPATSPRYNTHPLKSALHSGVLVHYTPLVFLQGAQDILNELPVEYVEPHELKDVSETQGMKLLLYVLKETK